MATKFLKSPNGGIYKDSNGKLVGVEPERVIRDIDGNIPASSLEDISVSTGTASTNGVTYIRATMKGEVTYTDNTHDTINYLIDLPIKAGDGVTIEAQPIEGATGNKQLVISASGGGGATLNKYSATIEITTSNTSTKTPLLKNILNNSKKAFVGIRYVISGVSRFLVCSARTSGDDFIIAGLDTSNSDGSHISYYDTSNGLFILTAISSTPSVTTTSYALGEIRVIFNITYWNDTEITE